MSQRLLLIEDEELVGTMVRMNLEAQGYEVVWITDGEQGFETACSRMFDLILLDIALPGRDGIEIISALRRREISTPILMLTARSDIDTKVKTLELGADDYLAKPFEISEMLARVKALVRRSQADREIPSDRVIKFAEYEISLVTREALTNVGRLVLSEKEAAIMGLLMRSRGRSVSRSDIIEEVWGMDAFPTERTVDNFIMRLRKLFEPDPDSPRHIMTVRGVGYCFKP